MRRLAQRNDDDDTCAAENKRIHCNMSKVEFLDPSVVSFFMHQLSIGDEDDYDEIISLCRNWGLYYDSGGENGVGNANLKVDKNASASSSPMPMKMLLVPINDNNSAALHSFQTPGGGNHWSLLVAVVVPQNPVRTLKQRKKNDHEYHDDDDAKKCHYFRTYFHLDSSRGFNASTASSVARKIEQMYTLYHQNQKQDYIPKTSLSVIECSVPQQINNYDCGVHTLAAADVIGSIGNIDLVEIPPTQTKSPESDEHDSDDHVHIVDDIKHQLEKRVEDFILLEQKGISEMTKHLRRSIADDINRMKV